jgi:Hydrophobic surface binding protein A
MRLFQFLVPLAVLSPVLAQENTASAVMAALADVSAKVKDLGAAIKTISDTSTSADIAKLTPISQAIITALNAGTKSVKAGKSIALMDAANILIPASELTTATQLSVSDLIKRKDIIVKLGAKALVLDSLKKIKAATLAFNKGLPAKMPMLVSSLATSEAARPVAYLDQGIQAFS